MTFAEAVTADNPTVWYDTRRISGASLPDHSGNGHDALVVGSPTVDTTLGAYFDNTLTGDDQFAVSSAPLILAGTTLSAFTFEGVVDWHGQTGQPNNPNVLVLDTLADAYPAGIFIVNASGSPAECLAVNYTPTVGTFQFLYSSPTIVPVTGVHHVAMELTGTTMNLYIDGALAATSTDPAHLPVLFAANTYAVVANDLCNCGDGSNLLIRHAVFYEHALGASRVAAHAAALADDPAPGSGYRFTPPTEDRSNIAYDAPSKLGTRLMSFFPNRVGGRAVWHLEDDTITFDQPIPTVFPDQAARGDLFPVNDPTFSNLTAVTVKTVYYGGSTYTITSGEAALISAFLTANGYTPGDWLVQN